MEAESDLAGPAVGYYVDVVRRRWWVPVLGAVLGLAVAVGLLQVMARTVTATTIVQLSIVASDPLSVERAPSTLLDFSTEQQIGRSFLVAERSALELGGEWTPRTVRDASEVSVGSQGSVALVRFSAPGEDLAIQGADAVAASYLAVRAAQVTESIQAQAAALQDRLTELEDEYAALQAERAGSSDTSGFAARELLVTQEMQQVVQRLSTLNSVPTGGGRVLTPASFTQLGYAPSGRLIAATGLLAGMLVGLAAAFLIRRRTRAPESSAAFSQAVDAPLWSSADETHEEWALGTQLFLAALPAQSTSAVLVALASEEDVLKVRTALRRGLAVEGRGDMALRTITLDETLGAEALAALRHSDAVALIVDEARLGDGDPERLATTLHALQAQPVGVFWLSRAKQPRAKD